MFGINFYLAFWGIGSLISLPFFITIAIWSLTRSKNYYKDKSTIKSKKPKEQTLSDILIMIQDNIGDREVVLGAINIFEEKFFNIDKSSKSFPTWILIVEKIASSTALSIDEVQDFYYRLVGENPSIEKEINKSLGAITRERHKNIGWEE